MTETSLKNKTAKGLFWGGLGTGFQQILGLIFGIALGRLLSRDDYGMIGMLTIFQAIASLLQESGFTSALAIRKDVTHKDYNSVFWFSITISLVIYLVLYTAAPLIADFYHNEELIPLARFSFLSFVISSTSIAPRAHLFRNVRAKESAIISFTSVAVSGIVAVILAFNGFAYWGIAIQTMVYCITNVLLSWHYSDFRPTLQFDFKPIKEMFGFSSKLLVTNLFITINNNLFSVILGRFYAPKVVGDFTQANKWNNMGHSFITGMINGVAQPILASVQEKKERQLKVFRKMLRFTAMVTFPLMFGLSIIAKEFIVITITEKWLESAVIMQLLCLWGAFIPINNLFSHLVVSRGHSNIYMYNNIGLSILQIAAVFASYPLGIHAMIGIFVLINILWVFVWQQIVYREIFLRLKEMLKDLAPYFLLSSGLCFTALILGEYIGNIYLRLLAKILFVGVLYLLILWKSGSVIFKECIDYFRTKIKHGK